MAEGKVIAFAPGSEGGAATPAVDSGGGGGHDDFMEARLSEVEKAIVRIDGKLDRIDDRFDQIIDSLKNLKWQLLASVVAVWLGVWGSSIAIQQMTVASFQAAGERAKAQAPAAAPAPQPIVIQLPPQAAASPTPAASR